MEHSQYVNEPYWRQQALFQGGHTELLQQFTVYLNGPAGYAQVNMLMTNPSNDGWVEAEVPIWQGPMVNVVEMFSEMARHHIRAQHYLQPF